ncbi:rCG25315 [Rattus norvegicus]|uniref:RCG25315 n=1 Tax=Rattus norvegicus TaxID=10116 RepID=A6I2N8_RAT|nr:rCG25315 [Rattus norvegicus]
MSFPICGVPGLWGIEKVRSKMDLEGERGIKTVAEEVNVLEVLCAVWKWHNETHYFAQLLYTNKIIQFGQSNKGLPDQ